MPKGKNQRAREKNSYAGARRRAVRAYVPNAQPISLSQSTPTPPASFSLRLTDALGKTIIATGVAVYTLALVLATMTTFAQTFESPKGPWAGELSKAAEVAYGPGAAADAPNVGLVTARIIQIFFGLLGVIFTCYVIYAGFLWLTAAGEEDRVKKARAIIWNSILGLIVSLVSFGVADYILGVLAKAAAGRSPI